MTGKDGLHATFLLCKFTFLSCSGKSPWGTVESDIRWPEQTQGWTREVLAAEELGGQPGRSV